jgi:hypothetical protein
MKYRIGRRIEGNGTGLRAAGEILKHEWAEWHGWTRSKRVVPERSVTVYTYGKEQWRIRRHRLEGNVMRARP